MRLVGQNGATDRDTLFCSLNMTNLGPLFAKRKVSIVVVKLKKILEGKIYACCMLKEMESTH